ncbi:MAG: GNAT family N-acetyltransferase [Flavobacteriaceae bacterium]|nr:GNAT family N-acetyltransferase [Flavobacteriaceae bacterium]
MIIRKIQAEDNQEIEEIVKSTIVEYGLPTKGSAYADRDTQAMYEGYLGERAVYFVAEENSEVIGGGGIKPLKGYDGTVCELQKMYLKPSARGKGYGQQIFYTCLKAAKELGYKQCYLESDPSMITAINIYEKNGFKHLKGPIGNTGHPVCGVWMLKDL